MADAQISFYLDEHVARAVALGLRQRGIEVLTVQEAGLTGESDLSHLALAAAQGRVIFTQDDDFLRLHALRACTLKASLTPVLSMPSAESPWEM